MEDIQIWELVDANTKEIVKEGDKGLTVCSSLNSESSPQLRFLVGDYTTYTKAKCPCGRTHLRAVGSFSGRADDLINLRGIKMYPIQIEQAVRSIEEIGDEYEVVINTNKDDLDIMTVRVEHTDNVTNAVQHAIQTQCEIRAEVEVLQPGTLPKTEFKANRILDERNK
jgi:phenylacetate-CoA ligase